MFSHMAKRHSAGVIKLKILRRRDYPELRGWILNSVTSIVTKGSWIHKLFWSGRPNPNFRPFLPFLPQSSFVKGWLCSWVTKHLGRNPPANQKDRWSQKMYSLPWIVLHLPLTCRRGGQSPLKWSLFENGPRVTGLSQTGKESRFFTPSNLSLLPKHRHTGTMSGGNRGSSQSYFQVKQ